MRTQTAGATTLRSYPHPSLWLLVLILVGLATGLTVSAPVPDSKGHTMPWGMVTFFDLFFLVSIVPIVIWLTTNQIILTETGLRWRTRRGWQSAGWEQVTDYCWAHPSFQKRRGLQGSSGRYEISLEDGRTIVFGADWRHCKALMEYVRSHARTTETGDWEWQGLRLRDLPLTFVYDPNRIRSTRRLLLGTLAFLWLFLLGLGSMACWQSLAAGSRGPAIVMALMVIGFASLITLMLRGDYRALQKVRDYFGETWVAYREGFVFRDREGEERSIPWETVVGYDFGFSQRMSSAKALSLVSRVRTVEGREYAFHGHLTHATLLQEIIRRRAVHGIEARFDYNSRDALGGIAARWTGGTEGVGDRVFHARTRSNRSRALLPLLFLLLPLLEITMMLGFHLAPADMPVPYIPFLIVPYIPTTVGIILMRTARVEVGKERLCLCLPFVRRTIAWSEIDQVKREAPGPLVLKLHDGTQSCLHVGCLAYGTELQPLIEERLRG